MKDKDTKLLEEAYNSISNTTIIDGIKIIPSIKVYDSLVAQGIFGEGENRPMWDEIDKTMSKWADEHDAIYYARPREDFNIYIAARMAKEAGKSAAVVEDLS